MSRQCLQTGTPVGTRHGSAIPMLKRIESARLLPMPACTLGVVPPGTRSRTCFVPVIGNQAVRLGADARGPGDRTRTHARMAADGLVATVL